MERGRGDAVAPSWIVRGGRTREGGSVAGTYGPGSRLRRGCDVDISWRPGARLRYGVELSNLHVDELNGSAARVSLGLSDVAALARLRDAVLLEGGAFETALSATAELRVDRGSF